MASGSLKHKKARAYDLFDGISNNTALQYIFHASNRVRGWRIKKRCRNPLPIMQKEVDHYRVNHAL